MANISLKLSPEKIAKLKETFRNDIRKNPNEYVDTFIQNDDLTITVYTSGKTVFQGKDAFFYASAYLDSKTGPQAGSDEVGTGDYFGPVVVAACIVEEKDYPFLEENGVTDSKQMTDSNILEIAPLLRERLKHSLLILEPKQYNAVHASNNMNAIKARMHNQAYVNLLHKGYSIPKAAYVDQFVRPELYFSYLLEEKEIYRDLIFETKAEEKYPAVAAASVISRYAFLMTMKKMEQHYAMSFRKGAGDDTDADAFAFVKRYGKDRLGEVAKLHFKNTEKIFSGDAG